MNSKFFFSEYHMNEIIIQSLDEISNKRKKSDWYWSSTVVLGKREGEREGGRERENKEEWGNLLSIGFYKHPKAIHLRSQFWKFLSPQRAIFLSILRFSKCNYLYAFYIRVISEFYHVGRVILNARGNWITTLINWYDDSSLIRCWFYDVANSSKLYWSRIRKWL